MKCVELPLSAVDDGNETFRISEELECPMLRSSLEAIGQTNPVRLLECDGPRLIIVCGFRRMRALKEIGTQRVWAQIQPGSKDDWVEAYRMAIWENAGHRRFCALEKARILRTLRSRFSVPHDVLVANYLPILDLATHRNVLSRYLCLDALQPDLRRLLREETISLATAERLAACPQSDQAAFASIFRKARFSASMQRQVIDLVEELANAGKCGIAGALEQAEIQIVLDDAGLSPFQKGEQLHRILRHLLFPRLSRARKKFEDGRNALQLPGNIRLLPDPFFESGCVKVEFAADSPGSFRKMAASLDQAARSSALECLFEAE